MKKNVLLKSGQGRTSGVVPLAFVENGNVRASRKKRNPIAVFRGTKTLDQTIPKSDDWTLLA